MKAAQLLNGRSRIVIDRQYKTAPKDVLIKTTGVRLDAFLTVGNRPGLDMVLPETDALGLSSGFTLDIFKQCNKEFPITHGRLGFDIQGSMFYFGQSSIGDNAFIAFVPNDYFTLPSLDSIPHTGLKSSLTVPHQRAFKQFIANCIARLGIGYGNRRDYEMDLYAERANEIDLGDIGYAFPHMCPHLVLLTDIPALLYLRRNENRHIRLSYSEMKALDELFRTYYPSFVANMPADWDPDEWWSSHSPVAVCVSFGQNCPIDFDDDNAMAHFANIRRWGRCRTVCWALATDIG